MSLPNFMCIGAAKSGTTTLYDILKQHPDVFIPSFKEPHFFDIPDNYKRGLDWYEREYFRGVRKSIIGDFTPSYFFEAKAPERIFTNLSKDLKFVVLLRHPADRAYSHYLHSLRDGHEDCNFLDALQKEDNRITRSIKNNNYLAYLRHSYYHQGLYGDMIERYLKYFSLESFYFIHFENEFLQDRKETIDGLLRFLRLKRSVDLNIDLKSNPASQQRSKLINQLMKKRGSFREVIKWIVPSVKYRQIIRNKIQRANTKELEIKNLSDNIRQNLYTKYFEEDIMKFERLTNKKLGW